MGMSDKETSDSEEEELRPSRPLSSDYSDVDKNKREAADLVPRRPSSSSSSEAEEAVKKAPANGSARPISSDYSDIFDKNEVGKIATNIKRQETSSPEVRAARPVSSDCSDIIEKTKETITKKVSIYKYEDIQASSHEQEKVTEAEPVKRQDTSSSEEQHEDDKMMQQSSSDSSVSKQKSDQELTRQDAFEIVDQEKKVAMRRKQSSSEYSESDVESRRGVDSSSDYDSAVNRGKQRRPDSMISDTSSDYDSVSNVGSRTRGSRPASFLLDDEYDVITEESESRAEKDDHDDDDPSSSSESEGPDAKDAGKKTKRIPPPGILKESSGEDEDQDGDEDQITAKQPFIPPTLIPDLTPSSVASSSILIQH